MERLKEVLSQSSLIALDTMVFIYHFEENQEHLESTTAILSAVENGDLQAAVSVLALTEILVKPLKDGRKTLAEEYRKLLRNFPNLQLLPVTAAVADRAAILRAGYNIATPDALHLATAIEAEADCFITHDSKLARVEEIEVVRL